MSQAVWMICVNVYENSKICSWTGIYVSEGFLQECLSKNSDFELKHVKKMEENPQASRNQLVNHSAQISVRKLGCSDDAICIKSCRVSWIEREQLENLRMASDQGQVPEFRTVF
jgi:hypothetical protein